MKTIWPVATAPGSDAVTPRIYYFCGNEFGIHNGRKILRKFLLQCCEGFASLLQPPAVGPPL